MDRSTLAPQTAPGLRRSRVSALAYAGFALLTLVAAVGEIRPAFVAAAALLALYLALEIRHVPAAQRSLGLVLGGAGLALGYGAGALEEVATGGVERALQFLVLFAAVACLRVAALESPALRAVGQQVVEQPPGRRFLALAFTSNIFGAVLNLAGVQLVATVLARQSDPALKRRLALAMIRGFSAASCWSPLFVSTAVVLSILPELSWFDFAPFGMMLSATMILVAWGLDRLTRSGVRAPAPPPPANRRAWLGALTIFLSLVVPILALSGTAGLSTPVAIGIVAPVHALIWLFLLAGRTGTGPGRLMPQLLLDLPSLRSEVLLFTGASLFGTGVSAMIGHPDIATAIPTGDGAIAMIIGVSVALGLIGLHPVIPVIVIGEALPPAVLGLPAEIVALCMVASWGLATVVSPFSGTALYMGRQLSLPVWTVAWRWNAAYGIGMSVIVILILMGLRHTVWG